MSLLPLQAPETISPDASGHWREWDTKADIWSLGMFSRPLSRVRAEKIPFAIGLILHKLLFFRLPYGETDSYEELGAKIHQYPGCVDTSLIEGH